eukprot:2397580-Amphidinium_carterae.1
MSGISARRLAEGIWRAVICNHNLINLMCTLSQQGNRPNSPVGCKLALLMHVTHQSNSRAK